MTDPLDLLDLFPTAYEIINHCPHPSAHGKGSDLTCDKCGDVLLNLESERQHAEDSTCEAKLHPFGHDDY